MQLITHQFHLESDPKILYTSGRGVPKAASHYALLSVSYMEKSDAQIQLTRGRVVPEGDARSIITRNSLAQRYCLLSGEKPELT
jgi:hypothetical protein